jgi:hypothetical protein
MAIKRKRPKPIKRRVKRRKSKRTSKVKRRKSSSKIPRGFVEVKKKLPGFNPVQKLKEKLKKKEAELKKLKIALSKSKKGAKTQKKKLIATEKKLKAARVKRQVQLLKDRNKARREVSKLIVVLNGLDEDQRIRAIRRILSVANEETEYWALVKRIADELDITTHHVLLYMYIRL